MKKDAVQPLRVVFMGSAELSCRSLDALLSSPDVSVVGVLTQPDRPKGRSRRISPCDVRAHADTLGLPTFAPEKVNTEDCVARIAAWEPDLIVVVAYGQILRPSILSLPEYGCINVHTSILPQYRGASPIQAALLNGDAETGVSIMYMDEGMDTGDVILTSRLIIDPADNAGALHDKLAVLGAEALVRAVGEMVHTKPVRHPQNHDEATYSGKISKQDGEIDWALSAEVLVNKIRAYTPWPGARCRSGKNADSWLKIVRAVVVAGNGEPGSVLRVEPEGPVIATGQKALKLLEVQPPGRTIMTAPAYLCGHPLQPGDTLG